MNKCSNPKIGRLIARYEFDLVSKDEKALFEAHLLECEYCIEDLYSMSHVTQTIKENPDAIINALRENLNKRERFSLSRLKELSANFINDVSDFISSLMLEHRVAVVSTAAFGIIILFSIILWKNDYFARQTSRPAPELAEHKMELKEPSKIEKPGDSSGIYQQKPSLEKAPDQVEGARDLASLAVIEHERYSSLLSQRQGSKSETTESSFYDGIKCYEEKNYRQAIISLSLLERTDQNYLEAQFYLGMCYLLSQDIDRGIRYLQFSTGIADKILKDKAHWYLGNAYLIKNDSKNALNEFYIVAQMNAGHANKANDLINRIKKE